MLVLSRKLHEEIVIQVPGYHEIVITPTDIRRDKVRIGIKADDTVQIWRREVLNQRQAASTTAESAEPAGDTAASDEPRAEAA